MSFFQRKLKREVFMKWINSTAKLSGLLILLAQSAFAVTGDIKQTAPQEQLAAMMNGDFDGNPYVFLESLFAKGTAARPLDIPTREQCVSGKKLKALKYLVLPATKLTDLEPIEGNIVRIEVKLTDDQPAVPPEDLGPLFPKKPGTPAQPGEATMFIAFVNCNIEYQEIHRDDALKEINDNDYAVIQTPTELRIKFSYDYLDERNRPQRASFTHEFRLFDELIVVKTTHVYQSARHNMITETGYNYFWKTN